MARLGVHMLANFRWRLLAFSRKIWVRSALYSVVGVTAVLLSAGLGRFVPEPVATSIGSDAVGSVLRVIAASMLSVTIFALSTLVGALSSATSASPRATRLLVEDPTAQGILATFLGVFIFSLVGIIGLSSGAFGPGERFVLFIFTLALVAVIVTSLIRWIQHITRLGRVDDTIDRVERVATDALEQHRRSPQLGGRSWSPDIDPPDADAFPLFADRSGYIRYFDIDGLASHLGCSRRAWVLARPGSFVGPNRPLALVSRTASDDVLPEQALASLRSAWLLDDTRNFDQDPRFGLCVLAEVASRALSPAINDVGTAIDVLGRMARVLAALDRGTSDGAESDVRHGNILLQPLEALELLRDAFRPIARDGAGAVELGLRLQATLAHIARLAPPEHVLAGRMDEAAASMAGDALCRARRALSARTDVEEIEQAAAHLLRRHGNLNSPTGHTLE